MIFNRSSDCIAWTDRSCDLQRKSHNNRKFDGRFEGRFWSEKLLSRDSKPISCKTMGKSRKPLRLNHLLKSHFAFVIHSTIETLRIASFRFFPRYWFFFFLSNWAESHRALQKSQKKFHLNGPQWGRRLRAVIVASIKTVVDSTMIELICSFWDDRLATTS